MHVFSELCTIRFHYVTFFISQILEVTSATCEGGHVFIVPKRGTKNCQVCTVIQSKQSIYVGHFLHNPNKSINPQNLMARDSPGKTGVRWLHGHHHHCHVRLHCWVERLAGELFGIKWAMKKKHHWLFRVSAGDEILPRSYGDYLK